MKLTEVQKYLLRQRVEVMQESKHFKRMFKNWIVGLGILVILIIVLKIFIH